MAQSPLGEQFHEAASLAVFQLRRLSGSRDIDRGMAIARETGKLDEAQARFISNCISLDRQLEAGEIGPETLSYDQVDRMQRCIEALRR